MFKLIICCLFATLFVGCSDGIPDRNKKYKEVCIGGHVYYEYSSIVLEMMALAPKLHGDGKPVKCIQKRVN